MKRTQQEVRKLRDKSVYRYVIREQQLRDFPYCKTCDEEKGRLRAATQVDHIVPLEQGGDPFSQENLQSLCDRCHRMKSGKEQIERFRAKKSQ